MGGCVKVWVIDRRVEGGASPQIIKSQLLKIIDEEVMIDGEGFTQRSGRAWWRHKVCIKRR